MAIGRLNIGLTGVQPGGLAKIVPTSLTVGSGSGSVDSNGAVTFSGASSVSLNGVFSSSYKNYQVMVSNVFANNATDREIQFRLRASGTDNSTASSYISQGVFSYSTTTGSEYLAQDKLFIISTNNVVGVDVETIIINPFTTDKTGFFIRTMGYMSALSGGSYVFYTKKGLHNQTVSYDGITLISASGTITGAVSVYGYN